MSKGELASSGQRGRGRERGGNESCDSICRYDTTVLTGTMQNRCIHCQVNRALLAPYREDNQGIIIEGDGGMMMMMMMTEDEFVLNFLQISVAHTKAILT